MRSLGNAFVACKLTAKFHTDLICSCVLMPLLFFINFASANHGERYIPKTYN